MRDVHPTHWLSMPIETPEGPNIGLINSLATYARTMNTDCGVALSSGRQWCGNKEVEFLSAIDEAQYVIARLCACG